MLANQWIMMWPLNKILRLWSTVTWKRTIKRRIVLRGIQIMSWLWFLNHLWKRTKNDGTKTLDSNAQSVPSTLLKGQLKQANRKHKWQKKSGQKSPQIKTYIDYCVMKKYLIHLLHPKHITQFLSDDQNKWFIGKLKHQMEETTLLLSWMHLAWMDQAFE